MEPAAVVAGMGASSDAVIGVHVSVLTLVVICVTFGAIGCVVIYVLCSMVVVPERHVAVVERWGKFDRVLRPGLHMLSFAERLKKLKWTALVEAPGRMQRKSVIETYYVRTQMVQIDIPGVQCASKDRVGVNINGTLLYNITDVIDVVYKVDDALNYLCQCTQQAVRTVTSQAAVRELYGRDRELASLCLSAINELVSEYGVCCTSFIVQSIYMDPSIAASNQEEYLRIREEETRIRQQQVENRRVIEAVVQQREQQSHRLQIEAERQRAALAVAVQRWAAMKESGFTSEEIVCLERTETMSRALEQAERVSVVQIPWNEMTNGAEMRKRTVTG